jgi:hypothetical protein
MDNPLEQPAPEGVIERVHEFARDLAYGVAKGLWKAELQLEYNWWRSGEYRINRSGNDEDQFIRDGNIQIKPDNHDFFWLISSKWSFNSPIKGLLLSFGYIQLLEVTGGGEIYTPTQQAFKLLNKPSKAPTVFISYSRKHSSALALLIEARLKIAGIQNPFVDKNLKAGEPWHEELKATISKCQYFVCLIGKQIIYDENEKEPDKRCKWVSTLDSEMVRKEIAWAEQAECKIISIWHNGALKDANTPESLGTRHYITVKGDSALDYETAVNEMLNSMGYSTY